VWRGAVDNLFVPDGLVGPLRSALPREPGPLYAFGIFPTFGVAKAAVALGIARHAIEASRISREQPLPVRGACSASRPAVQTDLLGQRSVCVQRSAGVSKHEAVGEIWQSVVEGNPPSHGRARMAAAGWS
jgi:hypothetical protein